MSPRDKPLAWLRGEVKTPPFSQDARIEAGCHELRIVDRNQTWRIVYRIARDAVVILDVFSKKTPATPPTVITECRKRLEAFQTLSKKKDANAKRKT